MSAALLPLRPVRPGARVAVLSLASGANPELVRKGVAVLQQLGYVPMLGAHALGKARPYFAATPEHRLQDLHQAFADPSIEAILCTRGGYGSNYLLPHLDLDLVRAHPKPLFGYSDYTAIQTWLLDQLGLPAFHGPMAAADFARENGVDLPSFQAALAGEPYLLSTDSGLRPFQQGTAEAVLYGGCLSLLVASLGTRYAAQTEGKLLFLEDVGAKPYQVDRMLRQLMLAGKLEGVPGISLRRNARLCFAQERQRSYWRKHCVPCSTGSVARSRSVFAPAMSPQRMSRCHLAEWQD